MVADAPIDITIAKHVFFSFPSPSLAPLVPRAKTTQKCGGKYIAIKNTRVCHVIQAANSEAAEMKRPGESAGHVER